MYLSQSRKFCKTVVISISSDYILIEGQGATQHQHQPPGQCNLGHDCPVKGEKLVRVIILERSASGVYEGRELEDRDKIAAMTVATSGDQLLNSLSTVVHGEFLTFE